MATGEHTASVSVDLRGNAGLGDNNPLMELRRQAANMSAEERESFCKRLLKLVSQIRNGSGGTVAG